MRKHNRFRVADLGCGAIGRPILNMSQIQPERSLTVLSEAGRGGIQPQLAFPEIEPEESTVPLSHYFWILKRHLWRILAFVTGCVIATVLFSMRIQPIYESTATVDIDRHTPTGVIGQEAIQTTLNDSDQFLATQINLGSAPGRQRV